ncbi:zf-HC2 domain-containing protein [Planctomycetota bacterium]
MKCNLTNEELNQYLDGMLSNLAARQVEQHLMECKKCSQKYDRMFQLVQDLRGLQKLRARDDTADRVLTAIAEGRLPETVGVTASSERRPVKFYSVMRALAAACILMTVSLLAVKIFRQREIPDPNSGIPVQIPDVNQINETVVKKTTPEPEQTGEKNNFENDKSPRNETGLEPDTWTRPGENSDPVVNRDDTTDDPLSDPGGSNKEITTGGDTGIGGKPKPNTPSGTVEPTEEKRQDDLIEQPAATLICEVEDGYMADVKADLVRTFEDLFQAKQESGLAGGNSTKENQPITASQKGAGARKKHPRIDRRVAGESEARSNEEILADMMIHIDGVKMVSGSSLKFQLRRELPPVTPDKPAPDDAVDDDDQTGTEPQQETEDDSQPAGPEEVPDEAKDSGDHGKEPPSGNRDKSASNNQPTDDMPTGMDGMDGGFPSAGLDDNKEEKAGDTDDPPDTEENTGETEEEPIADTEPADSNADTGQKDEGGKPEEGSGTDAETETEKAPSSAPADTEDRDTGQGTTDKGEWEEFGADDGIETGKAAGEESDSLKTEPLLLLTELLDKLSADSEIDLNYFVDEDAIVIVIGENTYRIELRVSTEAYAEEEK